MFEFFEGQHVHGLEGLHAGLQAPQLVLQGFEAALAHVVRDLGQGVGQFALELFEAPLVAPLLLGDGLELLSEPLPFPLLLLQGLALGPQLGFGGIPGAAALAKARLQIALLAFQGGAALLVGLMPLFPGAALGHQAIHRRHQPLLVCGEGFELVAEAFGRQGPLAPGRQQVIPMAAGQGQGLVGGFQLRLQALPAGGIP